MECINKMENRKKEGKGYQDNEQRTDTSTAGY